MDFMEVTAFKLSEGTATAWITAHVLLKFSVGVVSTNFVMLMKTIEVMKNLDTILTSPVGMILSLLMSRHMLGNR